MSTLEIAPAEPTTVELSTLTLHLDLQCRAKGVNKATVGEYSAAMKAGAAFPPITVVRDSAGVLYLADGWHRVAAAQAAGLTELAADIRSGSRKDALLLAAGSNGTHGLRRTHADKRAAVRRILEAYPKMSDRKIGEAAHVDNKTVAAVRKALAPSEEILTSPTAETSTGELSPKADAAVARLSKALQRILEAWPAERRAELQERLLEAATAPGAPPP